MDTTVKKGKGKKGKGNKTAASELEELSVVVPEQINYLTFLIKLLNEEKEKAQAVVTCEKKAMAENLQKKDVVRPTQRIIVYGGRSSKGLAQQDLWSLNYTTGEWSTLKLSKSQKCINPHPRFGHTMISTSLNNRIALFGGSDGRARLSDAQVLHLQINPNDGIKAVEKDILMKADPSTVVQKYYPAISTPLDSDNEHDVHVHDNDLGVSFGWVKFGKPASKRGSFKTETSGRYLGTWNVTMQQPMDNKSGKCSWKYDNHSKGGKVLSKQFEKRRSGTRMEHCSYRCCDFY